MAKNTKWLKYIGFAIVLALLVYAFSQFDAQSLWSSVKQIPLWSVCLLLALQIMSILLVNLQWGLVAKCAGSEISFRDMLYINSQGAVMDSITPGVKIGGEVTRAIQLSRVGGGSKEQAISIVALQKVLSIGAFALLAVVSAVFFIEEVPSLAYIVPILLIALFILAFIFRKKIKQHLLVKGTVPLFLLSLAIWLIYPLKLYFLAMPIMPDVSVMSLAAVTFVSYMVAMIPIFPGGLGGFEGTSVALLVTMGFAQSDALVITVIFRFITFWLVMLLSLAFIGYYRLRQRSQSGREKLGTRNEK